MKTEKIKLVITVILIILGTVVIFYSITESILDAYYLKKDFAYTISSDVYYTAGGKINLKCEIYIARCSIKLSFGLFDQ